MKFRASILYLVCLSLLAGCGPGFTPELNPGDAIPPGKVLVIGKFVVDPPFDKVGKKKKDKDPLEIKIGMTHDLNQQVKEGSLYLPDEGIAPVLHEVFFFPLPPGTRYIRTGQVMKVIGHHMTGSLAGTPVFEVLNLYRNIKLDVPANAKAVYIGTIVYKHDGEKMLSAAVRDDYEQALQELARMKIPGIKSGDVVKRLSVVVR